MKRICVFCGSAVGARSVHPESARQLGALLAARGLELVFGGGHIGLMGVLADAVLAAGGRVIGVIPQSLVDRELAHSGLSELHVVASMHQRKGLMADLSDAFVALAGGTGTLDELFEIITWAQLNIHSKRVLIETRGSLAVLDRNCDICPRDVGRRWGSVGATTGRQRIRLHQPHEIPMKILDNNSPSFAVTVTERDGFSARCDDFCPAPRKPHQQLVDIVHRQNQLRCARILQSRLQQFPFAGAPLHRFNADIRAGNAKGKISGSIFDPVHFREEWNDVIPLEAGSRIAIRHLKPKQMAVELNRFFKCIGHNHVTNEAEHLAARGLC